MLGSDIDEPGFRSPNKSTKGFLVEPSCATAKIVIGTEVIDIGKETIKDVEDLRGTVLVISFEYSEVE